MKNMIAFLFFALPLTLVGAEKDPFGMLTVEEVSKQLGKRNVHIYDANSDATYAAGHVPSATHVKFNAFPADVLPKDKNAELIFYCQNPH